MENKDQPATCCEQSPTQQTPAPTPAAAPVDDLIDIEHFAKVKMRVARIEAAEAVPKSKKLLKLQVDLGEHGKRQILSGIAQYFTPEALIGKRIVVVANLKPATLMGLESQGMLLASSTPDGSMLTLVQPEADIPLGSQVR
jgi:methionyl-tRNA synthetase